LKGSLGPRLSGEGEARATFLGRGDGEKKRQRGVPVSACLIFASARPKNGNPRKGWERDYSTVDSLITHTPRPLADGACVSNETKRIIPEHSQICVLHKCQLFAGQYQRRMVLQVEK
jgi:hypothetical protein